MPDMNPSTPRGSVSPGGGGRAIRLIALFALAALPALATPYTLSNTEIRALPHSANGRDYTLYVGLPASYATAPARSYPVVYITDGYWDFHLLCWAAGNLVVDGQVPECIVVGIAYAGTNPDVSTLRAWDLTPVYDVYAGTNSGHAQEFLGVIASQIIPFVEQNYRADPSYRVLGGSSYGGLFSLYALFERTGLFNAHIAISPSLWYAGGYIAGRERTYGQTHAALNERVYLTYAGGDSSSIRDTTKSFAQQLRQANYTGLASAVREIEGEFHSSTKAEGYMRGLRFAFAPLAPSPSALIDKGYGSRSPFVNLSTRGHVGTGDAIMIAGLVIDGPEPKRVLIRAVGPGLVAQGVPDAVTDPKLTLVDANHATVASNDNWGSSAEASEIRAAAVQVGAFALAQDSRDAAILVTLEPGLYTALVDGVNGAEGVALVEAYEVLP